MGERPQLIPCDEAVRQLWDYLDGAADHAAADRARVAEHLSLCRRCCGELEFVERLRAMLASQAAGEVPPAAMQRLEQVVEEL